MTISGITKFAIGCAGVGLALMVLPSPLTSAVSDYARSLFKIRIETIDTGTGYAQVLYGLRMETFEKDDEDDSEDEYVEDFTENVDRANETRIEAARDRVDHGVAIMRTVIRRDDGVQRLINESGIDEEVYIKLSKAVIAELLVAPPVALPRFMAKGSESFALLRSKYAALSLKDRQLMIENIQGDGSKLKGPVKEVWTSARAASYALVERNEDFSACVEEAVR